MVKHNEKLHITPEWVSGFCQAEGCFHVSFTKRLYRKVKLEVRPSFSIMQRAPFQPLLEELRVFFQCGSIRYSKREGMYRYEIRSLHGLRQYILPHFQHYPLLLVKQEEFLKFEKICGLLQSPHATDARALREMLDLAYSMNRSSKRKHKKEDLLKLVVS